MESLMGSILKTNLHTAKLSRSELGLRNWAVSKRLLIITTTIWIKLAEVGGVEIIEREALDLIINKILPPHCN